jgi:molybdopterin converting factor small subunit
MNVKIVIPPLLIHLVDNNKIVYVKGKTVGECLDALIKQYPQIKKLLLDESGKVQSYIDVYVNGESSYPEELDKAVNEGDELCIISVIAGG